MFDVSDVVSWLGSTQEQLGHLDQATELLAEKSERVRTISAKNPNDPRWKVELSTAQLMQSELLRVRGRYSEAYSVANEAVERMKPLTVRDPGNKEWSQDYLYSLLMRAAARIATGNRAEALGDLALAQPLLDALGQTEAQNRSVRRDLFDAASLRIMLGLQNNDHATAQVGAEALRALDPGNEATPASAQDAGRYGLSQIAAGMAAVAGSRQSDADVYFSAARRVLEPLAGNSSYWRVLDPWARLSRLSGNTVEADRVEKQLSGYGYVPLFPWSGKKGADQKSRAVRVGDGSRPGNSTSSSSRQYNPPARQPALPVRVASNGNDRSS